MIELPFHLPSLSEWIEMLGGFYGAWGYPVVLIAATIENTFILTAGPPVGEQANPGNTLKYEVTVK